MLSEIEQRNAPGEDRTHNLRIAHTHTAYKYGALTDCATGAKATANRLALNEHGKVKPLNRQSI